MPSITGETAGTDTNPPDVTDLCGMKKKMPGQLAGHVFDPGRGGGYRTHDPALIKHPL